MKISNILTCAIVSILVAGCANNNLSPTNTVKGKTSATEQLLLLRHQTESNNDYVVTAKNQLHQMLGNKYFNNYVIKHGLLNCASDTNQSSCVLSFYLNHYYKLKYDAQLKKVIEESQAQQNIELSKIKASPTNINNYCQRSADFTLAIYAKDKSKIANYYQPLFKMTEQDVSTLQNKILKDNYSQFLISENPTILQEIKADYVEKCLSDPESNIINYFNIFR
ncbi:MULTISPECIES: hypothetical protein [unclassified Gilliamella]|uniref:hypothetical protein n=1 Tax=unclassified Gilliamella TaxID=2685620 RepID=UPI001C69E549|nr:MULTISPECIES: hypothetical protein [unclassified Gilliamella]MCX8600609.1 hypothetical protein [Gilliamella sp. B3722]MCX8609149.1 hypothetical protein [Gilliamella sp. B3771]MCX8609826.1 hypothetical protein [Gilliamella sp. B3891]MCX8612084.1 hypothetical protein [Gilliamella sp. B3773]MCX8615588.1 hypothetical protein [Gilliamella sp. B3770]